MRSPFTFLKTVRRVALIKGFSESQKKGINHFRGPCMVIAGPGSGKTTVITGRIKQLIEINRVNPREILVISFTRAASGEMERRFKALTGEKNYPVWFGTFHSVFFWIIKTAYKLNNNCVISDDERISLMEQLFSKMSLVYENKDDIMASVFSQISFVKCDMLDIDNYYSHDMPEAEFRALYKDYNQSLRKMNKIDFDDMMVICYELLTQRKDILNRCRGIFRYIMVDEFQDCNKIQYEILKLLMSPDNNGFVVGDDDQSVYGFRGAKPEIMQQFTKDFPDTALVYLGANYRCDRLITKASDGVIKKNRKRFEKNLFSFSREDGKVVFLSPTDTNEENDIVAGLIRDNVKKGISHDKQAVIYRTNIQPRRLIYKLNRYNIPYTIKDVLPNIFTHFAIRNILDYMKAAMGDNSRGTLLRIINKPGRYISRNQLIEDPVDYDKLRYRLRDKEYIVDRLDKFILDMKLIRKMRPYAAVNFIRKSVGYDSYIKEYAEYRGLDCSELFDIIDEFQSMLADMTSFGELFLFVDEYSELLKRQQENTNLRTGVNLVTMHSSKGLEYDVVYIIDAVEDITPYKKARSQGELEEERRMFYVAMTRARHELYILSPDTVSGKKRKKSRFAEEAGNALKLDT